MHLDHQSLLLTRHTKVAGDQVELGVGRGKVMLAVGIACVQPRTTGGVIQFQVMQAMRCLGGLGEAEQPFAIGQGVGRKIQHHVDAGREQIYHQRAHHTAHLPGTGQVIGNRLDPAGIQRREPVVFAEQDSGVIGGKTSGKGGFAGRDLAAEQVQGSHGTVPFVRP